jgi:hypothetical protein
MTTVPLDREGEAVNLDDLAPEDRREFLDAWCRWRRSLRCMTDGEDGDCISLAIATLSRELTDALERLEQLEDRLARGDVRSGLEKGGALDFLRPTVYRAAHLGRSLPGQGKGLQWESVA